MQLQEWKDRGPAVKGLCEAFEEGRPPHAVLLLGTGGVGKRTLASLCVQTLFCTDRSGGPLPCGRCDSCRRVGQQQHPDVHLVEREKNKNVVSIDSVRKMIETLHRSAVEGGWKAAVIGEAWLMNPQAQNCILKTLEEPPPRTVIILCAVSAQQMLPTVRSRCRVVTVGPLPRDRLVRKLVEAGIGPERAAALADTADGNIGQALANDRDEKYWAFRDRLYGAMASIDGEADVPDVYFQFRDDKDKAEGTLAADLLESALHTALMARLQGAEPLRDVWAEKLRRADPASLTRLLGAVVEMRQMRASNVPWLSALERFIFRYAEEIRGWSR